MKEIHMNVKFSIKNSGTHYFQLAPEQKKKTDNAEKEKSKK